MPGVNEFLGGGILRDQYGREVFTVRSENQALDTADVRAAGGVRDSEGRPHIVLVDRDGNPLSNDVTDGIDVRQFGAVGDGVTDDTAAIQAALDDGGVGARIALPLPAVHYKLTEPLRIEHEGVELVGAGWETTRLVQHTDGVPIISLANYVYLHSWGISNLRLGFNSQQASGSNGYGIAFDGPAGTNYYHGRMSRLKFEKCAVGIGVLGSAGGTHAVWNCLFDQLMFSQIADSLIDLYAPVATGNPVNYLRALSCLNGGVVPADAALKLYGEWVLEGFDLEDWTGVALHADSGFGSARGIHLERHDVVVDGTHVFYVANGDYSFDGLSLELKHTAATGTVFMLDVQGRLDVKNVNPRRASGSASYAIMESADAPDDCRMSIAGARFDTAAYQTAFVPLGSSGLKTLHTVDGLPPEWDPFASLPAASSSYRGRKYRIKATATNAEDKLVTCLRQADGTYAWVREDDSQPHVRLSRAAVQSIPNSTLTTIAWTTEISDDYAMHAANSTDVVITEAGLYYIEASIIFAAGATGRRSARLKLGSSLIASGSVPAVADASASTDVNVSTVRRCAVGDVLTVEVFHTQGTALDVAPFQEQLNFTVTRVAA